MVGETGTAKLIEAIETFLKVEGLTQDQFAKQIGIDPAGLSRKLHGQAKFSKPDLDAIVNVYPALKVAVLQSIGDDHSEEASHAA